MTTANFEFLNADGRRLSGVLETGSGPVRAYAIFAHCFTCDKRSLAAVRISRAMADQGIGVLRFDFTGLGESEGEFGRGLSGDAGDVVRAAEAMAAAGTTPQVLIGHSFGGAAVVAAAGSIGSIRAVAVIGAPFDASHVLRHVGASLDDMPDDRRVPVSIAGREFSLGAAFLADVRTQPQEARINGLGRALLVLHSPVDEVVSIDNASRIFEAARHPKSFVSLDRADHLLRRRADADYAAGVVAAWAGRYVDQPEEVAVSAPPSGGLRVEETGAGRFEVRVVAPSGTWLVDEPPGVGGLGSGPTPYEMLGAGLEACTAMTCRLYAERKGWPLARVVVEVVHVGRPRPAPSTSSPRSASRARSTTPSGHASWRSWTAALSTGR